jgi:hypothetical protein
MHLSNKHVHLICCTLLLRTFWHVLKLGEKATILATPDYAYGAGGFPAWGIMPNSQLKFGELIQLLAVSLQIVHLYLSTAMMYSVTIADTCQLL